MRQLSTPAETKREEKRAASTDSECDDRRASLSADLSAWQDQAGLAALFQRLEGLVPDLLSLLRHLIPVVQSVGQQHSWVGRMRQLRASLALLHSQQPLKVETSETLVLPTLGSQEGTFENVRMAYSGDHGQTLRQGRRQKRQVESKPGRLEPDLS